MKTLALRARVFIHCFLVFGYPGETLALVVHILLPRFHTVFKHYNLNCRHLITAIDNAISAARFLSLRTEFPNPSGFQIVRVVMLRTEQQHIIIILIYCVVS